MRQLGFAIGHECTENLRILLTRSEVGYVRRAMADSIVEVYDRLHMRPAPAGCGTSRARNRALREGWAAPLAWDDIDRDTHPADTTPGRHLVALLEDFDWLTSQGESEETAAERLGVRLSSLRDQRTRYEREQDAVA